MQYIINQSDLTKFSEDKQAQTWLFLQGASRMFFFKLAMAYFAASGVGCGIKEDTFSPATKFFIENVIFLIVLLFIIVMYNYGTMYARGFVGNVVREGDIVEIDTNSIIVNDKNYTIKKRYITKEHFIYILKNGLIVFYAKTCKKL